MTPPRASLRERLLALLDPPDYYGFDREAEETIREAAAALSKGWQPIEAAPKDGSPVWVRGWDWGKPGSSRHHGWAFFNGEHWEWAKSESGELAGYLTHFLPLFPAASTPGDSDGR